MMRLNTLIVTLLAVLALTACKEKDPEAGKSETTGAEAAPVEKIIDQDIPDELAAEAEKEVTEENAEQVAAELEKEIDAELE